MATLQKLGKQAEMQKHFHHSSRFRLTEIIRTLSAAQLLEMFECCCDDADMEFAVNFRTALIKLGNVEMEISRGRAGRRERTRITVLVKTYIKTLSNKLVVNTDTANRSLMWLFVKGKLDGVEK